MQPRQRSRWVAAASLATVPAIPRQRSPVSPPPRPGSGSSGGSARAASPSPRPTAGRWGRPAGRSRSARSRTPARAARRTGRWATLGPFRSLPHSDPSGEPAGRHPVPRVELVFQRPHQAERGHRAPHVDQVPHRGRGPDDHRAGPGRGALPAREPGSRSRARRSRSPARNPATRPGAAVPGTAACSTPAAAEPRDGRVQPGRPARGVHRVPARRAGPRPRSRSGSRCRRPGPRRRARGRAGSAPHHGGAASRVAVPAPSTPRISEARSDTPAGSPSSSTATRIRPSRAGRSISMATGASSDRGGRRDALGGRGRVGVAGGDERGRGGQRVQPEDGLGDQAERPVRAGVQLAEVVAGHVLDDLAAGLGHGPVRADHGDPDQQVAGGAVAQPRGPAAPVASTPPTVGEPSWPPAAAGRASRASCCRAVASTAASWSQGHAGLRPDHQVACGVLEHPVQPQGVDDQVEPARRDAPGHAGAAAARHHREARARPPPPAGRWPRRRRRGRRPRAGSGRPPRRRGPPGRTARQARASDPGTDAGLKTAPPDLRRPAGARRGAGPGTSPHSRGVGKILPGLHSPAGSNAQRSSCMVSRSSRVNIFVMYLDLSVPTPCSPVIEPPCSMHRSRMAPDTSSARASSPGVASLYRTSGCRLPSPAWNTLATRIPDCGRQRGDLVQHLAERGARHHPVLDQVGGEIRPTAANADLRPAQIAARSAGSSRLPDLGAAGLLAQLPDRRAVPAHVGLGPVQLHDQDGPGARRVVAGHRGLGRLDGQRVHHLDGGGQDAGPDDRRTPRPRPRPVVSNAASSVVMTCGILVSLTTILVTMPSVPSEPVNMPTRS